MSNTTAATYPLSYYQVLSTFWAAACPACGTDLRGQSLVNLDVLGPVPHSFVAELGSKLRPAGIEHSLGQAGSGKAAGINLTDADTPVSPHEKGRQLMQEVLSAVPDLGVNSPQARLAPGALDGYERLLVLAIEARGLDLFAGGKCRQRLESKVDADLACPVLAILRNLQIQIEIPASAGILSEIAAANFPIDRTAQPKPVSTPKEDGRISVHAYRAVRLEGNPPQGFSATPSRPPAMCISGKGKLFADRLHCIRVQAKKLAAAGSEPNQIEAGGPGLIVPARGFLDPTAVIPNQVHGASLALKMPTATRFLDPVSVSENHANMVVDRFHESKTDAKHRAGIFTGDVPSALETSNTSEMTLPDGVATDVFRRRPRMRTSRHLTGTASADCGSPIPLLKSAVSGAESSYEFRS
ncbi:MAG TPA: hypothetical protein VMA54_10930 [Steroidobacteraceae bacterium]|nr:hypothetical protein [Steroidobacteraceae bacterium]